MSDWISVEDRLPEEDEEYIVFVCGEVAIGRFVGYWPDKKTPIWETFVVSDYSYPTHWQPLPEPPEDL